MNNLSLQTTQNTSVKMMSDSVNKASENAANVASTELNSPFQNMLNKQVQAQQSPAKQPEVKPAESKPAKLVNKVDNTQAPNEGKLKATNHTGSTTGVKKSDGNGLASKLDGAVNPDAVLTDTSKLAVKDLLSTTIDIKSTEASASEVKNKAAANASDLFASPLAPAMNMIPLLNTQVLGTQGPSSQAAGTQAFAPAADAATQSLLAGNVATAAQRNLAAALGNAVQQTKTANGSNTDDQLIQDEASATDSNRWLEAMLPATSKQALGDESANAKLIMNALKDGILKDSTGKDRLANEVAIKEITLPANYQPAAQTNAAASAAMTQQAGSANSINIYPGKTGWDQAISQKIVWMAGAGEQTATLTLNPPDLGPLQVVIHVHNDQVDTKFMSDNSDVRQALEDGMSNLRDKMNESGIQLGQTNVSSGEQSQQQFQQAMQQDADASQRRNYRTLDATEDATEISGAAKTFVRVSNGLVDTFA